MGVLAREVLTFLVAASQMPDARRAWEHFLELATVEPYVSWGLQAVHSS